VDVTCFGEVGIGTITILNYDSLEILETQIAIFSVHISYVPTLLSFREIPPAIAGIRTTIGATKSRLIVDYLEKDGRMLLVDKGEVIGEVVATKQGAKQVYVSVSNMVSFETAIAIVKHCSRGRVSEPLLQAHILAAKERICVVDKAK
jgi:deoxyinosine 3'endonuclease (endonuclease V)